MDTIFVKELNEKAQQAGLLLGDKIVAVNDVLVSGKSYKEVVELIQKSPDYLHLLVLPKEEDVIQKVSYFYAVKCKFFTLSPFSFSVKPHTILLVTKLQTINWTEEDINFTIKNRTRSTTRKDQIFTRTLYLGDL